MAAAWRLSDPQFADRIDSVTVYQRGWRLGGKGASSRGDNGRIEEHGLHVWLGYYENAFRLIREVYAALDRPHRAPDCPIRTWREAFEMSDTVGLQDRRDGEWAHWVASFTGNDELPGEADTSNEPLTPVEFIRRSLVLVQDFYTALADEAGSIVLSTDPRPPSRSRARLGIAGVAAAVSVAAKILSIVEDETTPIRELLPQPAAERLGDLVFYAKRALSSLADANLASRRIYELVDLVMTSVRGILADGLLLDPDGFAAVNNEEYRDWMRRHGAEEGTLASPLVHGVYDLVFGYQDGDPDRPRFSAGIGLFLSAKLFYDYKGSIFWKMQAGMGDVMFAPMYEALRERGVHFEFFSRVDELRLDDTGRRVEQVHVTRQAQLRDGISHYDPLIDVGGLPCFPARPRTAQLEALAHGDADDLETLWGDPHGVATTTLMAGRDFDVLVFAIPVGMVPHVAPQLVAASPRWASMTDRIGTVATQAFQLWLRPSEEELGWPHPGATMTGFDKPYDTYASMSHLIDAEHWPDDDRPATIAYFCSTLDAPPPPGPDDRDYPARMSKIARDNALEYLRRRAAHYWPQAADRRGEFRWELLAGAGDSVGEDRLESQYWTANVDPSDRYVQSLPGTDHYRLRPDESGFEGLFLAGDWTNSGLNAGCVEAAVMSGLQAANAILGEHLLSGVAGHYMGMFQNA